jgi:hypothetical protein
MRPAGSPSPTEAAYFAHSAVRELSTMFTIQIRAVQKTTPKGINPEPATPTSRLSGGVGRLAEDLKAVIAGMARGLEGP